MGFFGKVREGMNTVNNVIKTTKQELDDSKKTGKFPVTLGTAAIAFDMMKNLNNKSYVPPYKVQINGIDKNPQSYSEAIHEKLTNKNQGATDVSPLPKTYITSSPMPSSTSYTNK